MRWYLPWQRTASKCCLPFRLYCQISDVAEDEAEIVKPLAVILETEQDTVGAVRSMLLRVTVADAVIVPMDTPE